MLATRSPLLTADSPSQAVPQAPLAVSATPLPPRPKQLAQSVCIPPGSPAGSALKTVILQLRKTKSTPMLEVDSLPSLLTKGGPCSPPLIPHPRVSTPACVGPSVPFGSTSSAAGHDASLTGSEVNGNLRPLPTNVTDGSRHTDPTSLGATSPRPAPSSPQHRPDARNPPRCQGRSPGRPTAEKGVTSMTDQSDVHAHGGTRAGDPVKSSTVPDCTLQTAASWAASKTAGRAALRDLSFSDGTLAQSSQAFATLGPDRTPTVPPRTPRAPSGAPLGNASSGTAQDKLERESSEPSKLGIAPPLTGRISATQANVGADIRRSGNSNMPAGQPSSPQASFARSTASLGNPSNSAPSQPQGSPTGCSAMDGMPPEDPLLRPLSSPSNTSSAAHASIRNNPPIAPSSPASARRKSDVADGTVDDDCAAVPPAPRTGGPARRLALSNLAIPSDEGAPTPRCATSTPKAYPKTPVPGGSTHELVTLANPPDFHRASSAAAAACSETINAQKSGRPYPPTPSRTEGSPSRTPTRAHDNDTPQSPPHDNAAVRKISFGSPKPAAHADGINEGVATGRSHQRAPSPLRVGSKGPEELEGEQHREVPQKSIQWGMDRNSDSVVGQLPEQDPGGGAPKSPFVKGHSRGPCSAHAGPGGAAGPTAPLQDLESEEALLALAKDTLAGQLVAIPDGAAQVALRKQLQSARSDAEQALAKAEALEASSQVAAARAEELSADAAALEAQADAARRSGHRGQAAELMKSAPYKFFFFFTQVSGSL